MANLKVPCNIKANLESVETIYTNHPDYQWFIKIKCGSCGEVSDKWHDLMESERVPQKHNRSETHLLIKCKLCSRENSLDIIEGSNAVYTSEDVGKFKTVVVFDCRGIEPIDFSPRSGWIVESEDNGQKFSDVDLTEKEWVEYDEKNSRSVGIYELASQFIKIK